MTMFIMFPWAVTRLWNSRWNAMSFGPLQFRANLNAEGLKARWALVYFAPLALAVAGLIAGVMSRIAPSETPPVGLMVIVGGLFVLFYLAIPLATLHWFAKFYRKAAAGTSLGDLEFEFDATTLQWLGLFLGNLALAVVTLGFGLTYWGYRNWSFMIRHSRITGTIDVSELTQSTTHAPREAEGFADAFDIGAI
jgi:uncharacterized membrane protein YjgN (DUF898 family)